MNQLKLLKILEYYNIIFLILFTWETISSFSIYLYYVAFFTFLALFLVMKSISKIEINVGKKVLLILFIPLYLICNSYFRSGITTNVMDLYELFFLTIYVILLSICYSRNKFYNILAKYFIITIIMSFILLIIKPYSATMHYEGQRVLKGVYGHKNILARNMILGFIILFNSKLYLNHKILNLIYVFFSIIAIFFVVFSKSTACIFLLVIIFGLNILLINKVYLYKFCMKLTWGVIIAFNIFIVIISNPKFTSILFNIEFLGKNLTFTGRNNIWYYSLANIYQNPIFGYGYNIFWNSINGNYFNSIYLFKSPHSHNGYLNLTLDGGIVLLIIILIIFYIISNSIRNILEDKTYLFVILISIFTLIINLIESAFIDSTNYIFFIFICYHFINSKKICNYSKETSI